MLLGGRLVAFVIGVNKFMARPCHINKGKKENE